MHHLLTQQEKYIDELLNRIQQNKMLHASRVSPYMLIVRIIDNVEDNFKR